MLNPLWHKKRYDGININKLTVSNSTSYIMSVGRPNKQKITIVTNNDSIEPPELQT
jgi:hypothetical protein